MVRAWRLRAESTVLEFEGCGHHGSVFEALPAVGEKFNAKSPECSANDFPLRMLRLKFLHVALHFAGTELIQMSAVRRALQHTGCRVSEHASNS